MESGTLIRQLRQTRQQTLAEVGRITDLSVSYLSKIERGLTRPSLDTLEKLSRHFDVPVAHFLSGSPETPRAETHHLPSFYAFIERMNGQVGNAMQSLLVQVDAQANKPAQSVDDWLQYYYVISAVTSKA